ncbi:MAG TPA: hypothetical protein PL037_08230, partial [Elusimicrobiales bacterium]|nr:hypothetical protein [Elusimicrobiales bacterium]
KMIDPLTGTVLHTVEAQTERQWEIVPDWAEFEFEVPDLRALANMFGEVGMTPQFADLRDVPASLNPEPCDSRRSRLASMQEASLEAKAKYWAQRMRDPEFDSVGLRRNPGGEIRDPQLRKKFYAMVDRYYRSPSAPPLSSAEMDVVISVMGEERRVSDECGLH